MTSLSDSLYRTFLGLITLIAVLIAVVIPIGYFIISYQYIGGSIDAEIELSARDIERLVSNNPDSWKFEEIRIAEQLQRRLDHNLKDSRTVRDLDGEVIAQVEEPLTMPLMSRSHPIYDSGYQVATIEISRSFLPLLVRTAAISAGSLILAVLFFIVFRVYPPKTVRGAYKSILKSERRLRRAEQVANIGNWEYIADSSMVQASNGAAVIYGLKGKHWQIENIRHIALPEYRVMLDLSLRELIDHGKPYNISYKICRPSDGKIVDIQSLAEYDSTNRIVFGVIQDVTERTKAWEEKEKLEAQLLHSQKMETIGQLAGGIAHDFNNIITVISGVGFLLKLQLSEDLSASHRLDQILEATERATALTHSLLAFSRKQSSNLEPMDLNTTIRMTEKMLATIIGDNITIVLNLTERNAVVNADNNQMTQILMNLAANSRDSMPGGGTITIGTDKAFFGELFLKVHGVKNTSNYVMMTFSDTGSGMDEQTRQRIFEPFFTTKASGKGTGLGLAMVYGLVKQHKGFIDVQSEVGTGTTFKIYLPTLERKVKKQKLPELIEYSGLSGTILIVDDDSALRESVAGMLQAFGLTVIEAANGEDAVEKFRSLKDKIQLALMDVIMPFKNGMDAYAEIKAIKPDIKIIFMSGYSDTFLSAGLLTEENVSFISKPASPKKLFDKIQGILRGRTS